jgi:hypothetical protein
MEQLGPPQSTSVSSPFLAPSLHAFLAASVTWHAREGLDETAAVFRRRLCSHRVCVHRRLQRHLL